MSVALSKKQSNIIFSLGGGIGVARAIRNFLVNEELKNPSLSSKSESSYEGSFIYLQTDLPVACLEPSSPLLILVHQVTKKNLPGWKYLGGTGKSGSYCGWKKSG